MSEFHTPLDVRMLPEMDDQNWMLIGQLVYQSDILDKTIIVPVGFITDFVSFGPLKNLGQRPAVVHDLLYSTEGFDRELADKVLREALECVGVEQALADAMFIAVRAFGGGHKENLYAMMEMDGNLIFEPKR
jgi:hypothetical protein